MNIVEYINNIEWLHNIIRFFDMQLTAGVLVYKVKRNADISVPKQQLKSTAVVSLPCENMKIKFNAIYGRLAKFPKI